MKAITVCVGYADLLAITLPRNARHFDSVLVVTTKDDVKTHEVVASVPTAKCSITDAFYRYGAVFNKGLAVEEAGFDVMKRVGWICYFDADTLLSPNLMGYSPFDKEVLYSAHRRVLENPHHWYAELDWTKVPVTRESRSTTLPGYFHIFHADAQALKEPGLPWYDVCYSHAGGGDGFFQSRWPKSRKVRLPDPVLHLGPRDTNWFGVTEEGLAENARYRKAKGWVRGVPADPTYQERVLVPGHQARAWVYAPGE